MADDLFASLYGDSADEDALVVSKKPTSSSSKPAASAPAASTSTAASSQAIPARAGVPPKPPSSSVSDRPAPAPASNGFVPRPPSQIPSQPAAPAPPIPLHSKADVVDDGKMFIGGLSWTTDEDKLRDYFAQFGEVIASTVMRDPMNGRSRGFGFITFSDASGVANVLAKPYHAIDNKNIDPKRAVPRKDEAMTEKLFVRSIPPGVTPDSFRAYFSRFGAVMDSTLMMDRDTGHHRGFGFITYSNAHGVEAALSVPIHEIDGQPMEVKKSNPRQRADRPTGPQQPQAISTQPASGAGPGNAYAGFPMMNPYMAFGGMMPMGGGGDGQQLSDGSGNTAGTFNYGGGFDPSAMANFYAMAQSGGNVYAQGGMMDYSAMFAQPPQDQQPYRGGGGGGGRGGGGGPQRSYGRGGSRQHPYQRP